MFAAASTGRMSVSALQALAGASAAGAPGGASGSMLPFLGMGPLFWRWASPGDPSKTGQLRRRGPKSLPTNRTRLVPIQPRRLGGSVPWAVRMRNRQAIGGSRRIKSINHFVSAQPRSVKWSMGLLAPGSVLRSGLPTFTSRNPVEGRRSNAIRFGSPETSAPGPVAA